MVETLVCPVCGYEATIQQIRGISGFSPSDGQDTAYPFDWSFQMGYQCSYCGSKIFPKKIQRLLDLPIKELIDEAVKETPRR